MTWIVREYQCRGCGSEFEGMVRRSEDPPELICSCGSMGGRIPSAFKTCIDWGSPVSKGKSDPVPQGVHSTRALAEGMPLSEWKAENRRQLREMRHRQSKEFN